MSRPRGFSLIELLVVIAIIGVLASLTILGVMVAEADGSSDALANDLKQIGLGVHLSRTTTAAVPLTPRHLGEFVEGSHEFALPR